MLVKQARATLTVVELDHGESFQFVLADGSKRTLKLIHSSARIRRTNLAEPMVEQYGGNTVYRIGALLEVDGCRFELLREIGSDKTFGPPHTLFGMTLWLDAVGAAFDTVVSETHGECRPQKQVRLAVQDAGLRICPVLLHPWCPLPADGLRIDDCYCGDDCWLGAYQGASAHGGLDINHPAGTPLWLPISVDDQWLFNTIAGGDNNNRWRGVHKWPDGSSWWLESRHMTRLRVPEHVPVEAGAHYADGAGVLNGAYEHSHFKFGIVEPDDDQVIWLDPWLLFRQMYLDRAMTGYHRSSVR